ncbi:TPA: DinI family protein [Enterobacter hormaechei subsp. steigerwaltii]|nr:DinI family protein [Enterobacter hormaechei subsp. steigerwaltii]HAV1781332.1 DinI family protein [Enterobacter hormaechei subsp. steigerwaltii]HAV1848518.1 DinI family protein [Enterobacter hormaechei subsp. steigerwaltii]
MKIELINDCVKKLPDGVIPVLESELLKRRLTVFGGDKKEVELIMQETWESADEWFY